jgi:predicted Zn finger-like uncharacterized protein
VSETRVLALISRFRRACGIVGGLIVACTSCSVQYTVPDAKVRGRKVRVTCKHCRTSFVIDGTEKTREPLPWPDLPPLTGTDAGDDATRVVSRPDFSVHDEPTVVGQIPAAALEAERRYAQRTVPPPANAQAPSPASEPAFPARGSPASVAEERALPPYASEPTRLNPTPLSTPSSRPPPPRLETVSLLTDDLEPVLDPSRKRTTYLLLALAIVLVAAVAVVLTTR